MPWMPCFTQAITSTCYVLPLGGELQRFAIAVVAAQAGDIYMIDEPSSYLDVRQRLKAAQVRPAGASYAEARCNLAALLRGRTHGNLKLVLLC